MLPWSEGQIYHFERVKKRTENKRDSKDEMETVMTPSTPPDRRQKWTNYKQQYKEIILAYQCAKKD